LRSNVHVAKEFLGLNSGLLTAIATGYSSQILIGTSRGVLLTYDLRLNLVETSYAYWQEARIEAVTDWH